MSAPTLDPATRAIDALNAASAALLAVAAPQAPVPVEPDDDALLDTEQMAAKMSLTAKQLSRRNDLPFRVKLGHRTVRWSLRGYHKWLKRLAI